MLKFSKNFQKVTFIKHWTENLFSFRIARPKGFKFRSGEFVMIGLVDSDDKPILRAYSICSPSWSEELEFYSIIVKNGPLTSQLKKIKIVEYLNQITALSPPISLSYQQMSLQLTCFIQTTLILNL